MPSKRATSNSNQAGEPARRVIFLALALITLVSPVYGATPGTVQVAQTAIAISSHGTGSSASTANRYIQGSNPRKIVCQSREEAIVLGNSFARDTGAKLLLTSGTKSMEPLIHGRAYVVVQPLPYDRIIKGELLVYMGRPSAAKKDRTSMLHRTVLQDKGGWMMSGDNNRWTESWDRVTTTTYMGTVTAILEFPQV